MATLTTPQAFTATSGQVAASRAAFRLGFWAAILAAACTVAFAVVGVATPARSGPFCASACVPSPYVDVARFIPGDYLWLIPGFLLAPIFVILVACIHSYAAESMKGLTRIALSFALVYATVIMVNYFTQFTVVVPSLQSGETQGLSLFTQYNPHGFFIALEALAYLIMTAAFLFAAPAFAEGKVERVIGGLFILTFILGIASFAGLWLLRHDLVAFEVTILLIDWLAVIVGGALLAIVFRRAGRLASRGIAGPDR